MKTKINLLGEGFILEARLYPYLNNNFGFGDHYSYDIEVQSDNFGCFSFDFHGSVNDCKKHKHDLDHEDLIFAFYCYLSDAIAGEMTLEEFCNEFGYDEEKMELENLRCNYSDELGYGSPYIKCVTAKELIKNMGLSAHDLIEELQEKYPDCL